MYVVKTMSWRSPVNCFFPPNDQLDSFSTTHFCYVSTLHSNVSSNDAPTSFTVFLYLFWGQFKNKASSHYITRHHTAIRNGKNPPLQHKPRGVLQTLLSSCYGGGSAYCNWKHEMWMKFVQRRWVHLWKHKWVEHVAANPIIIPLLS
jgi:hypothetical protein